MNLKEILSVENIRCPLESDRKQDAINELVDVLARSGRIDNPDALKDAVWTREQTRTTGIGHGLAIPHGKCNGMDTLSIAIGKPAEPMDFDSMDAQPVELIVLLASPIDKTSEHIQVLAQVSRMINNAEFREKIYAASDAQAIYDMIASQ